MPSVLSDADKETVKRTVPKAANKIQAVAVARLYVAYPDRQRWAYTGLQGATVLANDLVGNTYWVKMVDISGSNRGVIWDQEIYDPFYYNQDRTFFFSFELEECLAGLSFVNEKEAKTFKKKMDDREKNASKETRATPFQGAGQVGGTATNNKTHGRFGLGSLLHGSQRHSSAPQVTLSQQPSSIIPREPAVQLPKSPTRDRASSLDDVDPSWRGILGELLEMGVTEDQIAQNQDFIKSYIEQSKTNGDQNSANITPSSNGFGNDRRANPPPPPPLVPSNGRFNSISPQTTGNSLSKRGPAPAPPQPRRSRQENQSISLTRPRSPSSLEERTPSPPRQQYQFRAPPPIADAGKFAQVPPPATPARPRNVSNVANPGPPPPPRPPKTPIEDGDEARPKFGVPPAFLGERSASAKPPPPPSRAPLASTSAHSKEISHGHAVPPAAAAPPLPPKQTSAPAPSAGPPPPPPARPNAAPPPPPLPSAPRPLNTQPPSSMSGVPPSPPSIPSNSAPPLPPLPAAGPPPPPLPPGGPGAAWRHRRSRAKKVNDSEKRDRSAAAVPGAEASVPSGGAQVPSSGGAGLQNALAVALSKRNKKVSASDDEDDDEDEWDDDPKRKLAKIGSLHLVLLLASVPNPPTEHRQYMRLWKRSGGSDDDGDITAHGLPPLPSFLDDAAGTSLGRSKAGKASSELKLRCTEIDESGNVTTVNGEFKKSELIAKYGLLPRDLRKIDSSLLPHMLVRPSAILINLLHLRVLIKHNRVLVLDAYGSTDSFTQSQFMYDLSGKLSQKETRQAAGLPYEFRALEAVLVSVTTGLEAEFEGVSEPVVRVLRELEEDIDRDKLRHLLVFSKKLGTFEQKARLVRDAIDDLLEADDDLVTMYLTERSQGKIREEHDHTEVEMLLESYHKLCDEVVQVSGNLVNSIRNTEEIVKAILDANRNSLMLLDLKFSIGTLGIGSGAFVASLYGMNLKNFIEESDLGFVGVTGWSLVFAIAVCAYGLKKLRKVQRVSMWGERGRGEKGSWRDVSGPVRSRMETEARKEKMERLKTGYNVGYEDKPTESLLPPLKE
ncbi:uncharacterized protein KY384_006421 [Bacidia gigantensis]|uniref:uncharacterized protein n=1 Tax=Bacidia gigantensis TaxID=2732470 RepID=UPI001D044036|nr:uncharacterized protein KY384_006421 [Bacidia gigantensis]KAG8528734.1 hypothetical protein KY384_006421 [Bacidia gigantensis]